MNAQKENLKKFPESLKITSVHKLPVCDENEVELEELEKK